MQKADPADYKWWRAALKGKKQPAHESEPQCGYWSMSGGKGAPRKPVAIWRDSETGLLIARTGFQGNAMRLHGTDINAVWTWVLEHPVTVEAYTSAFENGRWPNDPPTETMKPATAPKRTSRPVEPPHVAGPEAVPAANRAVSRDDNRPQPADEAERYTQEAAEIAEMVEAGKQAGIELGKVDDDDKAEKAQALRSRLLELRKMADDRREALKRPHLDAGKKIDNTFQPVIKNAQAIADGLRNILSDYANKKAKEAEKAAKEAAERVAEERRNAWEAGEPPPDLPFDDPAPVSQPTTIKGSYGRAASVRDVRVGTITDQDAVYQHFRNTEEVKNVLLRLVNATTTAGLTVPGVAYEVKKEVR